ncbi:efflux RND transporter periplasmic adaptor subunit [Verrucomicrobium sp. BvORR106]|uniref:efflux RND transporter periplasmic adaptor subunit n=1 Tax=Verrucomicrobium sp. BvORR106 TaxID=1403819 RepID=UPI00068A1185|nr:efflux RND transporter periplasmic adaptor subunit [Verrucomicrobium sp. BvORR106]
MKLNVVPHLAVALTAAVFLPACGKKKQQPMAPPPPAVIVAQTLQRTVPIFVENVAQTQAAATVEIRARVQGFLTQAPFREGGLVKKGDLLFEIDPKPYEAAVAQAKANVAKAEATAERARADAKRLEPLVKQNAISQQDLDTANANARVADSEVLALKAALTSAELSLGYTVMRAPFDGIIGARLVDVGNYVGSSSDTMLLAVVSIVDPMRVHFNVPEGNYIRFQRRFMGDDEARDKHSAAMQFRLLLSDGTTYEHVGKFEFADRALDAKAGTLKIVVSFPNAEGLLKPGQFGRVRAMTEERPDVVLVPQRAVVSTQSVQSVMVVGEGNKVEQRSIEAKDRFEDYFIVTNGLKAGERVVVEGLQKARAGMVVNPQQASTDEGGKPVPPAAPAPEKAPEAAPASAPAPAATSSPTAPAAPSGDNKPAANDGK